MLFIFDWDDTLFPTTYINNFNFNNFNYFKVLTILIINIFKQCKKYGKIIIITNANINWINYCLNKFMPELKKYIILNKINIISAREFSFKFNKFLSPLYWKKFTFNNILPIFHNYYNIDKKIISIGDSLSERNALIFFKEKNIYKKSIKMINNPNPNELILQLSDINNLFKKLILPNKNNDYFIKKK